MSTVVGLKTKDGVWIGSDSRASTSDGDIRPYAAKKIFNNGNYIYGFVGSVRCGQILRPEFFKPPDNPWYWPDALLKQHEEKGCLGTSEAETSLTGCNYLIIDRRDLKMYEILSDFQITEVEMTAIGSGCTYAFGSLFTTEELNIKDGYKRVELALKTAIKFDTATGPPIKIIKL